MWTQAPARVRSLDDLGQRIEGAGVDVAGLGAHDRRPLARGERVAQRSRVHAARGVDGDGQQRVGAEAEDPRRAVDRDVALGAHHEAHARSALQPAGLDVPPHAGQHGVARRRQAGDVRLLAARGQKPNEAPAGRPSSSSSQPPATSSTTDAAGDTE